MYCKHCGKYLLGDRDICDDCLAKQNQAQSAQSQSASPQPIARVISVQQINQSAPTQNAQAPTTTKEGWGKALVSAILSEVGVVFWAISLVLISMAVVAISPEGGTITVNGVVQPIDPAIGPPLYTTGIIFTLITIAASVIALIFGIQAVKKFTYARKNNLPKPVLAFVFGLIGLIGAAFVLVMTLLVNGIMILGYLVI